MSGILLSTTVAPQSSIVAQNNPSALGRGTEAQTGQTGQLNPNVTGQAAAIVQLATGESKTRAVGTGNNRKVDATFDKQEARAKGKALKEDKESSSPSRNRTVNVTA